jgi:sugar transferase (PEP-CTERM system associated)
MPIRSTKSQVRTPLLVLAGVESVILFSSVYVAAIAIFGSVSNGSHLLGTVAPRAALVTVVVLVSLIAMGLYQYNQRLYFKEAAIRVIVGVALAWLALAVLFYAYPSLLITRDIAAVAICYAVIMLLLARFLFARALDEHVFRRATLLFGAGERASSIADIRRLADRRGFKIVARVAAPGDKIVDAANVLLVNGGSIADIAIDKGADEIVVAMDDRRGNLPVRDLLNARLKGIDVIDVLEFIERESGKIRIDLVSPGWLIFSPGFRRSGASTVAKRILDILVSAALLVVGLPFMILIAVAIKIEDGLSAPVLYKQVRVGQGNATFKILKFRSMREDAEVDGKEVWASKDDSRVTGVGNFLRNSRLDELPQVFNVFAGHMSIVGPRPERPQFVRELEEKIPYYSERHFVKPGLTGWAQLKYSYGASEEDAAEKLQYDLYYVKNQTALLDISIIVQTVEVVLWGKGAR